MMARDRLLYLLYVLLPSHFVSYFQINSAVHSYNTSHLLVVVVVVVAAATAAAAVVVKR